MKLAHKIFIPFQLLPLLNMRIQNTVPLILIASELLNEIEIGPSQQAASLVEVLNFFHVCRQHIKSNVRVPFQASFPSRNLNGSLRTN
jgi:hypothetical protein